ncbi:AAA family ATPase [Aliarcobacter butzleri]|uniref:ATP-dependent nuclease n=1 Tax=Aliarcobacter butzleri TaxID=28197 RepID=UPI00263CED73|nr:AAA family ATPase [Aliarcobacter butzleri]MDN5100211.1 AAA family ATPase [Aliarcobacter butzleri]
MYISKIEVENYKGLKDISVPLSQFSCIIGENNAGKSTFMQALLLFLKGNKLSPIDDYYDNSKDVLITVEFSNISEDELESIGEVHRDKLKKYISNDGKLILARRYGNDGKSSLRNIGYFPKLQKFTKEKIDETFKGKKGKDISDTLQTFYHEVDTNGKNISTQANAKELIEQYIEQMPLSEKELKDIALESGFDNTITAFFPEPIYIPAVKDLSDDMKTKEGATFGKLLNILLDVIEEDLQDEKELFENLRKKLNRLYDENGNIISDDRVDKIKMVEETIQKNLNETFKNVSIELQIPQPEIKTILSSASVIADDGVKSSVTNKGDGFKRAITFSILRSYVELAHSQDWQKEDSKKKNTDKFLFLFEEPELYLHPKAQNILFEALALIAQKHQMLVTTHSPLFFAPDSTSTFIKIKKVVDEIKPYAKAMSINLDTMGEKDKFQLISFETSNQAFFSNKIVLVEGDSELIVLPHIAKLLNQKYDFKNNSISLVKINGKGSFKRYKEFFEKFDIDVYLITDLDILTEGFTKVEASEDAKRLRDELLIAVDKIITDENLKTPPNNELLKEELQKDKRKAIFENIRQGRINQDNDKVAIALEEFFDFEWIKPRLKILENFSYTNIVELKRKLFSKLREEKVFILEKGAIEEYYPYDVNGLDKPTKAQDFCKKVNDKTTLEALNHKIDDKYELEHIFDGIFS